MNRIMQMSVAYYELENPPFDEYVYFWKWMEASNREVERFTCGQAASCPCASHVGRRAGGIFAVYGLLSDYSIGAQSEMNTASYVSSVWPIMLHFMLTAIYIHLCLTAFRPGP